MKKAAAERKTTTPKKPELERMMEAQAARSRFFGATMNMGWRLAITVVVPIVAGVKLDERFNTSPSLTLVGLFIAATAGCMAVWGTVKEVNKEQEDSAKKVKGRQKRA